MAKLLLFAVFLKEKNRKKKTEVEIPFSTLDFPVLEAAMYFALEIAKNFKGKISYWMCYDRVRRDFRKGKCRVIFYAICVHLT